ncbi:winged helix-turn-helix domain-containing protein [Symbiopectobacterium sp. RP]|uniref:winged helix-turn-helix domain-containing protein n=1 Tax=Symbiopectobacterium sp. RP TaxID=3248553 RepID=UPI003D26BFE4
MRGSVVSPGVQHKICLFNKAGFSYKKPAGVPHKFSEENQKHFIEYYENLKKKANNGLC